MFPEGSHAVLGPFAPDCVNLRLATFSVFPSGHVPGTRGYSAGVDIPDSSQVLMSCETAHFIKALTVHVKLRTSFRLTWMASEPSSC